MSEETSMAETDFLGVAAAGDAVRGSDLQPSIDALRTMASAMNELIAQAATVAEAQEIARRQQQLRSTASALIVAQIELIVGEARISAEHINAATAYANDVIAKIAEWRKRIAQAGALLDFVAVVLTGDGGKILKAAVKLKSALDDA
jgi:hypothetical protein